MLACWFLPIAIFVLPGEIMSGNEDDFKIYYDDSGDWEYYENLDLYNSPPKSPQLPQQNLRSV